MADTASLVVRVTSNGVSEARNGLNSMADSAKNAAAAVGLVVSAGAAMSKLVQTARQTDILMASLKTMTGSAADATAAFGELQKFAAKTPYTLDQSVTAFTRLVSLGLTPSQKAIDSYGNTAAAMGKDLTQMIEAVADATTGEFERLKEFGIKSKNQGDTIAFTFQGVTTTVKNNASEIEGYLQSLGENQFAGAMANRMATLDGALSNLEDSWDGLFRAISSQGTGDLIAEQVRMASAALDDLSASISSGQALGLIEAWGSEWDATATDVRKAIDDTTKFLQSKFRDWGLSAKESQNVMSNAFWQFPANIRAVVQIATVEIAGLVDKAAISAKKLDAYLTPSNWFNDDVDIAGYYDAQLKKVDENVLAVTSSFLAQRDQRVAKLNEEKAAADQLRVAYDEQAKSASVDLSKYSKQSDSPAGPSAAESKAAKAVQKKAEDDAKRREEEKKRAAEYIEDLRRDNDTELTLVAKHEQDKLDVIASYRDQGLITAQEYEASRNEIARTARDERLKIAEDEYRAQSENQIAMAEAAAKAEQEKTQKVAATLDALNSIYTTFGGNMSRTYKAMFAASKIYAQKDAIVQQAGAMMKAWNSAPFPANLGAVASTALETMPLIATIATTSFSAREQGGDAIAGRAYNMAEKGKAEVIVPSSNSRVRTAQQMKQIMGESGSNKPASISIVNQTTGRVDQVDQQYDNNNNLILTIREVVSNDLADSNSRISKTRTQTRNMAGFA